jgi:hypothetical protein
VRPPVRRVALGVAWLACALLLAFGAAGLVAATSHQPGTPARAELTWAADEAVRPALAAASADLVRLASDVKDLGRHGRVALAALVTRDLDGLATSIRDGSALVATIDERTTEIGLRLAGLPGVGPGMEARLGPDVRARQAAIVAALESTGGLRDAWASLTSGSAAAARLTRLLADHDTAAAEAARLGSRAAYDRALEQLGRAEASLVEASTLRDALFNTADVSVLDEWLARNRALDVALRDLYTALLASDGSVTDAVRTAAEAERTAQQRLPPDTRGLVVIMADIARGGLNQAVIGIEQARGRLDAAVAGLAGS